MQLRKVAFVFENWTPSPVLVFATTPLVLDRNIFLDSLKTRFPTTQFTITQKKLGAPNFLTTWTRWTKPNFLM